MTNSTESPANSSTVAATTGPETTRAAVRKHFKNLGKLKQWTGAIGVESLQDNFSRQNAALWAEDIAARKALGIDEAPKRDTSEGGDMERQTILGDVTHTQPPVVVIGGNNDSNKPFLGTIAAIALGMAIPGAGILGGAAAKYFGDKTETVIREQVKDTATTLGLKRITDLNITPE